MLERFAAYLAQRLRDAGAFSGALATSIRVPEAMLGSSERWVLRATLAGPRLDLRVVQPGTGAWRPYAIDSLADLDACFDEVAGAVRATLAELTVHGLRKDRRYRVARDFSDFTGQRFAAGEEFVFVEQHFLPHDDGYTLRFVERTMGSAARARSTRRSARSSCPPTEAGWRASPRQAATRRALARRPRWAYVVPCRRAPRSRRAGDRACLDIHAHTERPITSGERGGCAPRSSGRTTRSSRRRA